MCKKHQKLLLSEILIISELWLSYIFILLKMLIVYEIWIWLDNRNLTQKSSRESIYLSNISIECNFSIIFYSCAMESGSDKMILKPGKRFDDVKSYRPISLLPITSKVMKLLLPLPSENLLMMQLHCLFSSVCAFQTSRLSRYFIWVVSRLANKD